MWSTSVLRGKNSTHLHLSRIFFSSVREQLKSTLFLRKKFFFSSVREQLKHSCSARSHMFVIFDEQFSADDELSGDPCHDVNKYLDVIFICVADDQPPAVRCSLSQRKCSSGQCIPQPWWCDAHVDCIDGSDEQNCRGTLSLFFVSNFIVETQPPWDFLFWKLTDIMLFSASLPPSTLVTVPSTTRMSSVDHKATVCEGDILEIECANSERIGILSAEFGHHANTANVCDSDFPEASGVPTCMKDAKSVVSENCNGQNSCKVRRKSFLQSQLLLLFWPEDQFRLAQTEIHFSFRQQPTNNLQFHVTFVLHPIYAPQVLAGTSFCCCCRLASLSILVSTLLFGDGKCRFLPCNAQSNCFSNR